MIVIQNKEQCCGCYGCYNACIVDAISMKQDEEGFFYPCVNKKKCIDCGLCERVCPVLNPIELESATEVYACYRNDLSERLKSASGGVFAVLAERMCTDGGIVYGAAFDKNFVLEHCAAITKDEIKPLLGSKYVQSQLNRIFQAVQAELEMGKKVLFSGTPCQVQGLKKYLQKDYEKLICIDLICHGVPSPRVWKTYIKEVAKGQEIVNFIPRDKTNGVNNAPLVFQFKNGKIFKQKYNKNPYIIGFAKNVFLRPACYSCTFKGNKRASDITLGDFWGIEKEKPSFYSPYGISAVLLNSDKGKKVFEKVKNELKCIPASMELLVKENPLYAQSVSKNEERTVFFDCWEKKGVIKTINGTCRATVVEDTARLFSTFIYYLKQGIRNIIRKRIN